MGPDIDLICKIAIRQKMRMVGRRVVYRQDTNEKQKHIKCLGLVRVWFGGVGAAVGNRGPQIAAGCGSDELGRSQGGRLIGCVALSVVAVAQRTVPSVELGAVVLAGTFGVGRLVLGRCGLSRLTPGLPTRA